MICAHTCKFAYSGSQLNGDFCKGKTDFCFLVKDGDIYHLCKHTTGRLLANEDLYSKRTPFAGAL